MASEKWLNFIEIKPYYLISYLMAMKSNGYCIVGAEQTASGTMLHKTPLPKKMILVLGWVLMPFSKASSKFQCLNCKLSGMRKTEFLLILWIYWIWPLKFHNSVWFALSTFMSALQFLCGNIVNSTWSHQIRQTLACNQIFDERLKNIPVRCKNYLFFLK